MEIKSLRHRRSFIKGLAFGVASSSLLGRTWTDVLAAEITPLATSSTGTLRIKLPDFPALLNESGSVRLAINPLRQAGNGPMPDGQFYPVIVNRAANNTFYALNSRCTHENCVVEAMDPSSNQVVCSCHGSIFGIDGRRIFGPANSALTKYTVRFDGKELLEVQIPGLSFAITGSVVPTAGTSTPRFKLDFRAFKNVAYEIQFRESLDKAPTPVPFSTTAAGSVDQTEFTSTTTANVSVFLDRASGMGIYSIALRVTEI